MRKRKGVLGLLLAVLSLFMLNSCGKVNTKSPEAVVQSLITAYQRQDEKSAKECFGLDSKKKCPDEVTKEIDYYMNLFKAHDAESVKFEKSDILGKTDKKELVYVIYNYEIKNKKEVQQLPGVSFYFVSKKEKEYHVVPAKDVTKEMTEYSGKKYREFVKIEDYKKYEKDYQEFSRKNPQYEKNMENRFETLTKKKK